MILSNFKPPEVEPIHAHWMVKYMSNMIEKYGQSAESIFAKPVVVPKETT